MNLEPNNPLTGTAMSLNHDMPDFYLETCFLIEPGTADESWPPEFAIITGYETTGITWPKEQNLAADRELEAELRSCSVWLRRVEGYSPTSRHAEPGWAVAISFDEACELGLRFKQDAIYYVNGDDLSVSYCDNRRRHVPVGSFRERVQTKSDTHSAR